MFMALGVIMLIFKIFISPSILFVDLLFARVALVRVPAVGSGTSFEGVMLTAVAVQHVY